MIAFWVVAGLLSAAAAGLILSNAARAARGAGTADPTLSVYRRQLAEIDDLAARGLMPEAERKTAHAEAARRLLAAADRDEAPWSRDGALRKAVLAIAALTPLVAIGAYLFIGAPGLPDQPIKQRIATWRESDPATLSPPQLAVLLRQMIRERPADPEAYRFLALAEAASDNPYAAARAARKAIELAPERADLWEQLGEALTLQNEGEVTTEAEAAFTEALTRDPSRIASRFHLARAQAARGDREGAVAAFRALLADLPADDVERRQILEQSIAEASGAPTAPAAPPQMDAIRGMVAGLAARLEANPEDPEGWVRLVRSYAVLGEAARRDAALEIARKRYAGNAEVLQALDAAAKTEPMK